MLSFAKITTAGLFKNFKAYDNFVTFSVCSSQKTKKGEEIKYEWVNFSAGGGLADMLKKHADKIKCVYVEGSQNTNKKDGKSYTSFYAKELVVIEWEDNKQESSTPEGW